MRFIPTNYNNSCPICQNNSGDCRTTETNLRLCHSFIDRSSFIAGWKWLSTSNNGVWGLFVPDNSKEFDRQQYDREKQLRKEQERDKKQFLASNALDAIGRDKAIRKLANHIGLNEQDKKALLGRGLSEAEIKNGLFFSVDPWKRFNLDLPESLPGVQDDRFTTRDNGFACPAFDRQGRAIGWQLRVSEATKSKYRWAKSLYSSQLPNTEYPLTLVQTNENGSKTLYLSEGLLKPYIGSKRLQIAICGAANNGNFKGSPEQLAEIISDFDELVITPDAGDVLNSHVMRRWERQINYLKRFNKPVKILWWGQVQKSNGDIDEIDKEIFDNSEYLTPTEFYKLAKKERYIQQQRDNWRNYKKFTPQIKIKKKFVEFGLPQNDTITFIKSGLGTGKTNQVIRNLLQVQNYGIIGLGYRNTLLLQFNEKAKEIGFYHLQSDKNLREFSLDDPGVKVTNCVDSLIHYEPDQFDNKIVVIDEIISVLKHFFSSPTIKQFSKVKELFSEMANRADRIICLDGYMQDWAVNFFKEICPHKQIITIENTFKGDKAKVYLLEGTFDIEEKIRVNDKTPWVQKLLNSYCPAIASDSQIFCEATENLLLEQGRRGIRVDSKTVSEKHVKEFFTDPDKYIQENKPEYIIYSPSAESGLDIPIKDYFTEHFAFFFGCLDIDSCIQMLGRVRDVNVSKYIWIKKFIVPEDSDRRPSNLEGLQADRARNLMAELHSALNSVESSEAKIAYLQQVYQDNLDPYTTAADTITAIRNFEFANYRDCLKEQLIDSGYQVEALTLESLSQKKAIAKKEKEAKAEVKQQNSKDIFAASDKYIGQQQINLNFDANWETRSAVIKAGLVARLPGINHASIWSPDFIKKVKYDNPQLIAQHKLYYLLENLDLAKQLSVEKYNRIFNQGKIAAPWKLRQDYLKVKALRDIGIYNLIQNSIKNPDFTYNADSPEVKAILDKLKQKKHRQILGNPGKTPIKFLNNLLRSVGIKTKTKKVKREGKKAWVYSIDQDYFSSQERLAILDSIKLYYTDKISGQNESLEWVADKAKSGQKLHQNSHNQKLNPKIAEINAKSKFGGGADCTLFSKEITPHLSPPKSNKENQEEVVQKNQATNTIQNMENEGLDTAIVESLDSKGAVISSMGVNLPVERVNLSEMIVTPPPEVIEEQIDPLDTEEAIIDLANNTLMFVEDEEMLASVLSNEHITRERMNRACKLLPLKHLQLIRRLNDNLKSIPEMGYG